MHIFTIQQCLYLKQKKSDPAEFWLYMCANKEACDLCELPTTLKGSGFKSLSSPD